jgi:alkylation response protein AidB-like acyl-CoA dehydrogenase
VVEEAARQLSLGRLEAILPDIADEADAESGFPSQAFARLRAVGVLSAPLPTSHGGLELGCNLQDGLTASFFRLLGRGSVAVGRLVEGHVNALRLVWRYGSDAQKQDAAAAAHDGALFGIWVTDGNRTLSVQDSAGRSLLAGGKAFCSGAGHVSHALVTARADRSDPVMLLIRLDGRERRGEPRTMLGVRGAVTSDMNLDGIVAETQIGRPGEYLREPEFSVGAWRGSAVACGALESLVEAAIASLVARDRHRNAHQAERIGRLLIARETCLQWVGHAVSALGTAVPADEQVARVNLARIAVETSCLEAVTIVQRALGLSALLAGSRIERLLRDLMTYLRQPAPDETLTDAAVWFAERGR